MTRAFDLIAKALSCQVPPRVLIYGLLNKLNYWAKTENRRFDFERMYLEHGDVWNYHSSEYERRKYNLTLAEALKCRSASESALEVGCSVGVFTRMLSEVFDRVVAIDFSKEALRAAVRYNQHVSNIEFAHLSIPEATLNRRFDVIFCAEILYYVEEKQADAVGQFLQTHLSLDGIVIYVTGVSAGPADPGPFYSNFWENALGGWFDPVFAEDVKDPQRPYRIVVFMAPSVSRFTNRIETHAIGRKGQPDA